MQTNIETVEFTIFDTETTGLDPESGDRIIEIAGIRFKGREEIARFESLVNPHRENSPGAFEVNRISQDMLSGAPDMEEVMPKFLDFVQGSCLCSYNAGFDIGFLENELKLLNQPALKDIVVVDVLKMSRRLLPGLERYALWFVAERLGIKIKQEHRAFSDVELTLGVFRRFMEMLKTKGVSEFSNFSGLFSINAGLLESLNNQKISRIQEAIDLGVRIKIKYLSSSGSEVTEREVIPKEFKQENKHSYLVGYCCLREGERTFRIDGILHLEVV